MNVYVNVYLLNIGIIVGVPVTLALMTLGLRRWRDHRSSDIWLRLQYAMQTLELEAARRDAHRALEDQQFGRPSQERALASHGVVGRQEEWSAQDFQPAAFEERYRNALETTESPFKKIRDDLGSAMEVIRSQRLLMNTAYTRLLTVGRLVIVLNIATTVIALIPIGFALYNLITNQQQQALTFNLAAIATLIVTKGGLFVWTWILLAAKAVPGAITGAAVAGMYNDWRKQREKRPADG